MPIARKFNDVAADDLLCELLVTMQLDGSLESVFPATRQVSPALKETLAAMARIEGGEMFDGLYGELSRQESAVRWAKAFLNGEKVPVLKKSQVLRQPRLRSEITVFEALNFLCEPSRARISKRLDSPRFRNDAFELSKIIMTYSHRVYLTEGKYVSSSTEGDNFMEERYMSDVDMAELAEALLANSKDVLEKSQLEDSSINIRAAFRTIDSAITSVSKRRLSSPQN